MKGKWWIRSFVPFYALVFVGCLVVTALGSRVVTVMSESIPLADRCCIIIDPGHGGVDGGATSCTGVLESKINLEISLRLNDLLRLLGYNTEMIRTTDVSVYTEGETIAAKKVSDLKQRVKLVNEKENAILVSIHQNYFSNSRYSGAQVFYPTTKNSEKLAKDMQQMFVSTLNPESNRLSKKADGIYLLDNIECTGVLIECGFLSNPEEEARLRDPVYQRNISCVIACSLSNFLDR